LALIWGQEAV
jgi:hypothetical protein